MNFINRLSNSIPITAPEAQPETTSQPQTQTNLGVANTADIFETNVSNNFGLMQQPENFSEMQPATTSDTAVDASSLFSDMTEIVAQPKDRLTELSERLDVLKEKRQELVTQIQDTQKKKVDLENAQAAVNKSLENDEPLSEEDTAKLDLLGVAGVIGGILTGLPVVSLLGGILGGLSAAYREKLKQAKNEIARQMAEADQSENESQAELEKTKVEEELTRERMEKARQIFTERKLDTDLVTPEKPWGEFRPPESLTQSNDTSSTVSFDSDIQKLIAEE
jgi:DNA-binding transcriptional MerR regulator/Sec-independent protein translocase protein TatA